MGAYKQALIQNVYYDMDVRSPEAISLTDLNQSLDSFQHYAQKVQTVITRHAYDRNVPADVVRVLDELDDALNQLRKEVFNAAK